MKKFFRYLLVIFATLMVVVAIVLASGFLWIQSSHGRQWLESQINTRIPGKITVADLDLSMVQPMLRIDGVVIKDPQGQALAGFSRFSAGLDWQGLLQREIRINHILLQEPWADVAILKDGKLNLLSALVPPDQEKTAEPPASGSSVLPFNIIFDSVQLTGAHFTFASADETMHLEVAGLTAQADGNLKRQSAKLELSVGEIRLRNGDLQPLPAQLQLEARLDGEQVKIATFKLVSGQSTLKLSGSADQLYTEPIIDAVLSLDSQLAELTQVIPLSADYSGALKTHLRLHGKVANPDAELKVSMRQAVLAGQALDGAEMAVMLHDRQITLDQATALLADGSVDLAGAVDLQSAFPSGFLAPPEDLNHIAYELKLVHDIPHLGAWLQASMDLQGATDGELLLSGKGVMPADIAAQMSWRAAGEQLIAPGMEVPVDAAVQLLADIQSGVLTVSELNVSTDGLQLEGDGRFALDKQNIAAKLSLTADDLAQALAVAGVQSVGGAVDAELLVDGSVQQPQISLDLSAEELKFSSYFVGDINSRIRLVDGTVFIDTLQVNNRDSSLRASGTIQALRPGSLALLEDPLLDLSVDGTQLNPAYFVDSASGDFSFEAAIQGSVAKPVGRIMLTGNKANVAGQPLEKIVVDARFKDQRLWLDKLLAVLIPGEQLEGSGWIGLDKTIDLSLQSTGISVSTIPQLQEVFPGKATLQLDVTANGQVDNPEVAGQLVVSDIVVREQAMEDGHFRFTLQDMLATVQGKLNFALQAGYELRKGDFSGRLLFDRTETAAYFKAAGQPELHGTLSGEVQAAGNIHDAANASVRVDLSALQLFYQDMSLLQSDRIALQLADQQLIVPPIVLSLLNSGKVQLQGDAQLGGKLNMQLDGHIPLAVAGYFSDQLSDATGSITLAGKLTGTTADPLLNGQMDMTNIAMTVPGLVQKLHDLNGRLVMTPSEIRIDKLKGFLDTGSFVVNGTVVHEKFVPTEVNLGLQANALPVEIADTLSLLVNADITITDKDRLGAVTGEIVLLEGLYYKDVEFNLLEIATDRKRSVSPPAKPVALPYFDKVTLDVKVKNRQPFYVQNNLADLEISPDLRVVGDLNQPIIGGRALVKEGTVTFQKKTFDVTKGVIDFVNPYRTEAAIDIQSVTTIRNWTITLAIQGRPDNLRLKLSSVPAESDSDILSLILFGRTGQELVAGEGGAKRSNAQIMAGMIADTFGDDIKDNTGLDILQLETGEGGNTTDTKVTVGKNLSDRMTVKYAVESRDGVVVQRAITEYKLLERILLSGFQDNQGVFGGELMFRIEFR